MPRLRWLLLVLVTAFHARAQKSESLFTAYDSTLSAADSLSVFNLIDSLLSLEGDRSQLVLRLGYNSNVLSAGRTLGIENFGLAPGLTYYHKSGFYADVTGYWSKDFTPSYYLTIASLGYMAIASETFSIMGGFDRYFYSIADKDSYIPYRNSLSITPILDFKPFSVTATYSFYFGDQHAHRVMPGISVRLEKRKFLKKIDKVSLSPSFFLLWGTEVFITYDVLPPQAPGGREEIVQSSNKVSGIMNHAFSFPLTVSHRRWNISLSYIYNVPKALKGEPDIFSNSSFVTGSLGYIIDFSPDKTVLEN